MIPRTSRRRQGEPPQRVRAMYEHLDPAGHTGHVPLRPLREVRIERWRVE